MPAQLPDNLQKERFDRLQELLFEEDRRMQNEIRMELEALRERIGDPEEFRQRVEPFLDGKVEFLKENFPELFGPMIARTIKEQIKESQDEMIDALYPIIGKLIRKFVAKEFERITEKVDQAMNKAFSPSVWVARMRRWVKGVKEEEVVLKGMNAPVIEEIFIVDNQSGLLVGSYSRNNTLDQDLIGGMLTAIKAFVEDAFGKKDQSLETIGYETYKIILQNFHTYYIAVVVSGVPDQKFLKKLAIGLEDFVQIHSIHLRDVSQEDEEALIQKNSAALNQYFDDFSKESK